MFHTTDGKEFLEFEKIFRNHSLYLYAWEGWEEGWKILEFTWFSGGTEGRSIVTQAIAIGYQFTANEGKGKGNSNFKEP